MSTPIDYDTLELIFLRARRSEVEAKLIQKSATACESELEDIEVGFTYLDKAEPTLRKHRPTTDELAEVRDALNIVENCL